MTSPVEGKRITDTSRTEKWTIIALIPMLYSHLIPLHFKAEGFIGLDSFECYFGENLGKRNV